MVHSELKRDGMRRNYYLLDQLRKKKDYNEFEKEYKDVQKEKDDPLKGSAMDFIKKYFISSALNDYSSDRDDFENAFEFSLSTSEYLVAAALISSFKHEEYKNLSDCYNLKVRNNLMDNLLEHLDSEKLIEKMKSNNDRFYPYVIIFYMIKMNKHKDNTKYYFDLKKLLKEYNHVFGTMEKFALWVMMETYCLHKKKQQETLLIKENYSLYIMKCLNLEFLKRLLAKILIFHCLGTWYLLHHIYPNMNGLRISSINIPANFILDIKKICRIIHSHYFCLIKKISKGHWKVL